MAVASAEEVHAYWFGDEPWANREMWYMRGRGLDPEVRARFADTVEAALRGELDGWAATARGRLCLIVVLDQFTRHVFRDTPRFAEGDGAAQRHALAALEAEDWRELRDDETTFLLNPLQHSEHLAHHERAAAALEPITATHPSVAEMKEYLDDHRAIVERFGRFPDRNKLLGRASTEDELGFLATETRGWFERQDL